VGTALRAFAHPTRPALAAGLVPGRSAALLQRCAAEPGPSLGADGVARFWVPALRSSATRCSASGTRET